MKKILSLLLFTSITATSFAQRNYQDVVYLKNGSVIRGIIVEQIPNKSIKIETADKSVFAYQLDDIEKFTKEPHQNGRNNSFNGSGLKPGYKGLFELGFQAGTGYNSLDRFKFDIINGYQLNPHFSVGIGTGVRYYFGETNYEEAVIMPLFADFRANFMDRPTSPYLSLGIGYSFDATDRFSGLGLLFNPTVGVSFKVSERSAMNVGVGFEMQRLQSRYYDWGYYEYSKNAGAINFNVGVSF